MEFIHHMRGRRVLLRIVSLGLVLALGAGAGAPAFAGEPAADGEGVVRLRSAEDFYAFARDCHVNSYSAGRTFSLETDLVLEGGSFAPVPTFGGTFEGNGHAITGFTVSGSASETGFFGTVEEGGTVRNLTLGGIVRPSGVQNGLGGVAGTNRGVIENVTFSGVVEGHNNIGGIAGVNEATGTISRCSVSGSVQGDVNTGGIAGCSRGLISGCGNAAAVNTVYKDVPLTTDMLSNSLETILTTGRINTLENADVKSDMGGIAGLSTGVIADCRNTGAVGYEHVGYNAGGIAGRTSGYIRACRNEGTVLGRKDVGGIVGQLVPFMELEFAQSVLEKLDTELAGLNGQVDDALNSASGYTADTTRRLDAISGLVDDARGTVKTMTDEAADRADRAAERANTATASAQAALSSFSGAALDAKEYAKNVKAAMDVLEGRIEGYLAGVNIPEADRQKVRDCIARVRSGLGGISNGTKELAELIPVDVTIRNLEDVLNLIPEESRVEDPADLALIRMNLGDIGRQYAALRGYVDEMSELLAEAALEAEGAGDAEGAAAIRESAAASLLSDVDSALSDYEAGLSDPGSMLRHLSGDGAVNQFTEDLSTRDFAKLLIAVEQIQARINPAFVTASYVDGDGSLAEDFPLRRAFSQLEADGHLTGEQSERLRERSVRARDCSDAVDSDLAKLVEVLRAVMQEDLQPAAEEVRSTIGALPGDLGEVNAGVTGILELLAGFGIRIAEVGDPDIRGALQALSSAIDATPGAVEKASSALDSLAALDISVGGVSETMRDAGTNLYSTLDSLQREMDGLNDSLSSESQEAIGSVRGINGQFNRIIEVLEDAYRRQTERDDGEEHITDVSDEDIEEAREGRTSACVNAGRVEADSNVGGIAGMIGVEVDIDPETDIRSVGSSSLDYVFRARGIIDGCENLGPVKGRGDYCGGIAGHMELGLVSGCAGYGPVSSDGDFVGGVAGYSAAKIRRSFAKAQLRGRRYVGGIAGFGQTLSGNAAMVYVSACEQYGGAIAGKVQTLDRAEVDDNVFVLENVHGIDGVSYDGLAYAVTYDQLMARENAASVFGTLVLTFTAEDETVAVLSCGYGEGIDAQALPQVPEKEGFFGRWSRQDYSRIEADEVVEAVYSRVVTLLAGAPCRENGQPILLAEGAFREGDVFHVAREPAEEGEEERLAVTPPEDGALSHTFRYLASGEGKEKLFLHRDGAETELETRPVGRYLAFDAAGGDFLLIVRREDRLEALERYLPAAAAGGAVLGLALVACGLGSLRRKRRRRRRGK